MRNEINIQIGFVRKKIYLNHKALEDWAEREANENALAFHSPPSNEEICNHLFECISANLEYDKIL